MVGNIYKVYKAEDYNSLDLSKFYSNIRWNLSDTEFIIEFREPPHGNTVTLSKEEANLLMGTEQWSVQADIDFPDDFEL